MIRKYCCLFLVLYSFSPLAAAYKIVTQWQIWSGLGLSLGLASTPEEACQAASMYLGYTKYHIGDKCFVDYFNNPNNLAIVHYDTPVQTCPYGGTLSGTECINAPECPANAIRNIDGACQAKDVTPALCSSATPSSGNPIIVGAGNKFQAEQDYSNSKGLEFIRYYHSVLAGPGGKLGKHWTHNYESYVDTSIDANHAVLTRTDGARYSFTLIGNVWTPDADITDILVKLTDTNGSQIGWRLTDVENGKIETYDITGRLTAISSNDGYTQSISYDSTGAFPKTITDSFGRSLTFSYNPSNKLATVTDPAGGIIAFAYDAPRYTVTGNVRTATYPDNKVRTYIYGELANTANVSQPDVLTGISDENGVRFATYQYDAQGRAVSTQHVGGADKYALTYNTDNSVSVTDPLSTSRTYSFQPILGVMKSTGQSQPAGSGCAASAANLSYDANGNIASRTDFNGNRSCFAYDLSRNLESARVEGLAPGKACPADAAAYSPAANTAERKITSAWHPDWRLEVKRTDPLKLTTWVYNGQPDPSNGNALASCAPVSALLPSGKPIAVLCKRIEQATTDATGGLGLSATVTGTPRTWAYSYNATGQVLTADGPRTDVSDITSYSYYSDTTATHMPGDLATMTNALGHVTNFTSYDKHGHLLSLTDPNGLVVSFSYDARRRLTARTVDGNTTGYAYDAAGNLTQVTLPTTDYLRYTYDAAHRLTDITDAQGNRIHYTLDGAGNRTQEDIYDPGNVLRKSHHQVYDALSRLSQDIGAAQQTRLRLTTPPAISPP